MYNIYPDSSNSCGVTLYMCVSVFDDIEFYCVCVCVHALCECVHVCVCVCVCTWIVMNKYKLTESLVLNSYVVMQLYMGHYVLLFNPIFNLLLLPYNTHPPILGNE